MATTVSAGAICFSVWLIFRDLSKTIGKKPQQSMLLSSVRPITGLFACFALSECSDILANGQDSMSIDWPLSVSQQNKKTNPLNHNAMNPAKVLCAIFFTVLAFIQPALIISGTANFQHLICYRAVSRIFFKSSGTGIDLKNHTLAPPVLPVG